MDQPVNLHIKTKSHNVYTALIQIRWVRKQKILPSKESADSQHKRKCGDGHCKDCHSQPIDYRLGIPKHCRTTMTCTQEQKSHYRVYIVLAVALKLWPMTKNGRWIGMNLTLGLTLTDCTNHKSIKIINQILQNRSKTTAPLIQEILYIHCSCAC